jgi:hypothetical protein
MTHIRRILAGLAATGAAAMMLKAARHADEAKILATPTARAAFEDATTAEVSVGDALTVTDAIVSTTDEEKPGTD